MKISVGMPPTPRSVEYAQLAESLGYDRVWLYDSAALYEDVYVHLARIAEHTDRIGIGTAVLVPNLRHVMTTASAIATIDRLAPGRLACGFGTGATARWLLNQPALTWKQMSEYLTQLRGLLAGEVVEIDGEQCQMMHLPELAAPRPIDVPLLVSALGPKGQGIARELADGLFTIFGGVDGWDWHIQMISGTVLEADEALTSDRVKEAAGPWYTVMYHGMWHGASFAGMPEAVDGLPMGAEWRAGIEAERPEGQRHLIVHEGHVTRVTDRDRVAIDAAGDAIANTNWIGSPDELRARAEAALAAGATEILYTPAGPDIPREMEAMAAALG